MNTRPGSDDCISINPTSDLVTFDDIPSYYVPGQDIFVIYQLGSDFKPTSRDWVGLFPCGWDTITKYVTFQWSPKQPRNAKFASIRSVLFLGKDIKVEPDLDKKYQFLYISKGDHVVGVSRNFVFSEFSPEGVTCTDQTDDNLGALTFVQAVEPNQKDVTDNFDLLLSNSNTDSESDSDLPLLIPVTEDHMTLMDPQPAHDPLKIINKEMALVPYTPLLPIFSAGQDSPAAKVTTSVGMPQSLKELAFSSSVNGPTVTAIPKSSTDKVFQDFVSLLNAVTWSPSPERPLKDKTPTGVGKKTCKVCRRRSVLQAASEKKYSHLEKENARVKQQIEELKDENHMKSLWLTAMTAGANLYYFQTLLIEELSKQVKNLISENSLLVTMKEKLERQMDWWECSSCRKKDKDYSAMTRELKAANRRLREDLEELESQLWTVQGERNDLRHSLDTVKCEQHDLGERYAAMETHLNDIMYTLSTKGVERIVDCNGNQTTTDVTGGTLLDLEGWQVASSKKTAKHLAAIVTKDGMIKRLQESIQELETNIGSLQREITQTKTEAESKCLETGRVKDELEQLRKENLDMKSQEESLSAMLKAERRKKVQTEKQFKEAEEDLKSRIESLTAALEVATLGARETKDKESETTRVVSVSKSCQSDKYKSYSKAVQVKSATEKPGKAFQVIHDESSDKSSSQAESTPNEMSCSNFFSKLAEPKCKSGNNTSSVDEEQPVPLTIQAPPLTWFEFPNDLSSFTPEEPIQSQPQATTTLSGHPLAQSDDRPLRPLWPLCLTKDDMSKDQAKQHTEKRPEMPKSEDRPLRPLWPFFSTNDDQSPKVDLKPDDQPKENPKSKEHKSFKPLWLESLMFPSNTKKSESKSTDKTPTPQDDEKKAKKLRFTQATEHPLEPSVPKLKSPKTKPSAKGRKAKKSEFLRMLRETEQDHHTQEFICPYCGHQFPSSTSQTAINRHLRLHSKINSHFS